MGLSIWRCRCYASRGFIFYRVSEENCGAFVFPLPFLSRLKSNDIVKTVYNDIRGEFGTRSMRRLVNLIEGSQKHLT